MLGRYRRTRRTPKSVAPRPSNAARRIFRSTIMTSWCAPDAIKLMPTITGCSMVPWAQVVADVVPRPAPVIYVNVGANKGYNVAEHMTHERIRVGGPFGPLAPRVRKIWARNGHFSGPVWS